MTRSVLLLSSWDCQVVVGEHALLKSVVADCWIDVQVLREGCCCCCCLTLVLCSLKVPHPRVQAGPVSSGLDNNNNSKRQLVTGVGLDDLQELQSASCQFLLCQI